MHSWVNSVVLLWGLAINNILAGGSNVLTRHHFTSQEHGRLLHRSSCWGNQEDFFTFSHVSLPESAGDVSLWLLGVSVNVLSLYNLPLSSSFTASLSQCSASELPDCFIEDAIMKLKQKPWKRSRISCLLSSSHNPALGSHQLCTSWYSEELHENPFTSPTEIFRRATWKSIQLTSQKSNLQNYKTDKAPTQSKKKLFRSCAKERIELSNGRVGWFLRLRKYS